MPKVVIYTKQAGKRLQYTCKIIFGLLLKVDYEIVSQARQMEPTAFLINYSLNREIDGLQILPSGLLESDDVVKQHVSYGVYQGIKVPFYTEKTDFPFDVFSAVFFSLTRYEEYLPFKPDAHDRFSAIQSEAYKNKYHHIPVVEFWSKILADKLELSYSKQNKEEYLTIDVDWALKYKYKGMLHLLGGLIKSIINGSTCERLLVLAGQRNDPYDTYGYLKQVQSKKGLKLMYFILLGNKPPFDVAHSWKRKKFRQLIKLLAKSSQLGIHPSYASNKDVEVFEKELNVLESVVGESVKYSRQHYLKLKFPDTYLQLRKYGVEHDFSMGWHDSVGFRAGISVPYPYYCLQEDAETSLIIHPFVAMDRTLKDYMGLSPEQAMEALTTLNGHRAILGGGFTMVWHNDSVGDLGEWKGWRKVFEHYIRLKTT